MNKSTSHLLCCADLFLSIYIDSLFIDCLWIKSSGFVTVVIIVWWLDWREKEDYEYGVEIEGDVLLVPWSTKSSHRWFNPCVALLQFLEGAVSDETLFHSCYLRPLGHPCSHRQRRSPEWYHLRLLWLPQIHVQG